MSVPARRFRGTSGTLAPGPRTFVGEASESLVYAGYREEE